MEIQITSQKRTPGVNVKSIKRILKKVLKDLDFHDVELSILLTDDERMAQLNRQYMRRKGTTNVLAFPMTGGPGPQVQSGMLGDIVVSVDTALREAGQQEETPQRTINRLLIHGLLHLIGHDHEGSVREARRMEAEEQRLLAVIEGSD
jgi:rRNA maturation RNase YbeY